MNMNTEAIINELRSMQIAPPSDVQELMRRTARLLNMLPEQMKLSYLLEELKEIRSSDYRLHDATAKAKEDNRTGYLSYVGKEPDPEGVRFHKSKVEHQDQMRRVACGRLLEATMEVLQECPHILPSKTQRHQKNGGVSKDPRGAPQKAKMQGHHIKYGENSAEIPEKADLAYNVCNVLFDRTKNNKKENWKMEWRDVYEAIEGGSDLHGDAMHKAKKSIKNAIDAINRHVSALSNVSLFKWSKGIITRQY